MIYGTFYQKKKKSSEMFAVWKVETIFALKFLPEARHAILGIQTKFLARSVSKTSDRTEIV